MFGCEILKHHNAAITVGLRQEAGDGDGHIHAHGNEKSRRRLGGGKTTVVTADHTGTGHRAPESRPWSCW